MQLIVMSMSSSTGHQTTVMSNGKLIEDLDGLHT